MNNKIVNNQNNACNIKYNNFKNKSKQNSIKIKNNSFIKNNINNNVNNIDNFKTINKRLQSIRGKSKTDEKRIYKKRESCLHLNNNKVKNNNNSKNKINSNIKRNINIKNSLNNNYNSINSNNSIYKKKYIFNKIKAISNNQKIFDKINNDITKDTSLFTILNNISQKNIQKSSNDTPKEEKEATIIHNKSRIRTKITVKKEEKKSMQKKLKNMLDINMNLKNQEEKKLRKHNTNNSYNIYNSFLEKTLNEPNMKIKIHKRKNFEIKNKSNLNKLGDINKLKKLDNKKSNKNYINSLNENKKKEIHKKNNTQYNLNALNTNFNFLNQKRRENNKSLYNFGNIYFINQNQIIKNDTENINSFTNKNNNNSNIINFINKRRSLELNERNKLKRNISDIKRNYENNSKSKENININNKINHLNISNIKQTPKIIMNFSKYKKKGECRGHIMSMVDKDHPTLNGFNYFNNLDSKEEQLISEHN